MTASRILIVDDDDLNRTLLRVQLEAEGYHIIEAADGQEALELLGREEIEVVVTDLLMPRMDGYRLCYEIRHREEMRELPIVVCSGTYTKKSDEQLALKLGANQFLSKPCSRQRLLSAVKMVAERGTAAGAHSAEWPGELTVMKQYSEALVKKLEDKTSELEKTQEQLREANERLERRVQERTAELRAANEELDAFAHSASHDLKAPLRAIEGFSEILTHNLAAHLDEENRAHFQRIGTAVQRMNRLIDDMLRLSSVSRQEISRQEVDLNSMLHEIITGLRERDPHRTVEARIHNQLQAEGDGALIRIALENLVQNAWKFTAQNPQALIEIGSQHLGDETIYFVRDNGVGFDMISAYRLFGVFQRLHSPSDFPGTGVGLATVQRIVHRHGGHIWAEAEVGKGATFYFTLGPSTLEIVTAEDLMDRPTRSEPNMAAPASP